VKPVKAKIIKNSIISLTVFVVIVGAASAAFLYLYPEEKVRDMVVNQIESSLKRRISIAGFHYGFRGIILKGITLYDGTDSSAPVLVKAAEASLGFSLYDLLQKKLNINDIYLQDLSLNIVFNEENKTNLQTLIEDLKQGEKKESSLSTKINTIRLSNALISVINPQKVYKPLAGTFRIDGTIDLSQKGIIAVNHCKITLPEDRGMVFPDIAVATEGGKVIISGDVGLEKTSLLWVYQWSSKPLPQPYHIANGDVKNLRIIITDKNDVEIEGNARASSTLLNSKNLVFADGFCRVSVKNRTVFLSNIKGKIDTSTFLLHSLLFTFDGSLKNFDARNIDAALNNVKPIIPGFPNKLFGKVSGNLSYDSGIFNGNLSLSDVGYDPGRKLISGVNTDLVITGNTFKKQGIPVTIMGNPCTVSVASTETSMDRIFLNINGGDFRLEEPVESTPGESPAGTAAPSSLGMKIPITVSGVINLNSIQRGKIIVNKPQVNYRITGNQIVLERFTANFMEGTVSGNGDIQLNGEFPQASFLFGFNALKIQNIATLSSSFQNRFFGNADGKGQVTFLIAPDILSTMNGNIEFSIDRGKIVNTGIQNGLGLLLAELKYKLKDLEFNKIYGNISFDRNNYIIRSFIFNSEDIRLKIQGPINDKLDTARLDINLEFTDHFIQDLPAVALGLRSNKRGQWYILPFIVQGNITEGKNIKRSN